MNHFGGKAWRALGKRLADGLDLARRERDGLSVLFVAALLLFWAPGWFARHREVRDASIWEDLPLATQRWLDSMNLEYRLPDTLFVVDPNTASMDQWVLLGIPASVARRIERYVAAGGRFREPEEVLKIYGFPEGDFERLADWLVVDTAVQQSRSVAYGRGSGGAGWSGGGASGGGSSGGGSSGGGSGWSGRGSSGGGSGGGGWSGGSSGSDGARSGGAGWSGWGGAGRASPGGAAGSGGGGAGRASPGGAAGSGGGGGSSRGYDGPVLDISYAGVGDLERLPGIGSVLAARAVRYRDRLGGFHSVSQFGEVYGIDSALFQALLPYIKCTPSVQRLQLNRTPLDSLKGHPYIAPWVADQIVDYREKNHGFLTLGELKSLRSVNDSLFLRLEPYLELGSRPAK